MIDDPSPVLTKFKIVDESQTGQIDVNDSGKAEIDFAQRVQGELSAVIQEPAWMLPRLANCIDLGIKHPDIIKPSAIIFIRNALDLLIAGGHDLRNLARNKYVLRKGINELISELRASRETSNYNALFAADAEKFETSADLALIFEEATYPFNQPYGDETNFNKHYNPLVGDPKDDGEEFNCAVYLDRHPKIRYWIPFVPLSRKNEERSSGEPMCRSPCMKSAPFPTSRS